MIKLNKPTNLNGTELLNELAANGIACDKPPFIDGDGDLWLDVKSADQAKATEVVAAHNGTTVASEPKREAKV